MSLYKRTNSTGLMTLLQHAEEDYSTLLHLERVLNMRECGDHREGDDVTSPAITTSSGGGGGSRGQSRRRLQPEGGLPFALDLSDRSGSGGEDVLDDLFSGGGGVSAVAATSTRRRPIHEPLNDQLDEEDSEGETPGMNIWQECKSKLERTS